MLVRCCPAAAVLLRPQPSCRRLSCLGRPYFLAHSPNGVAVIR
jgi:hypothetical protein